MPPSPATAQPRDVTAPHRSKARRRAGLPRTAQLEPQPPPPQDEWPPPQECPPWWPPPL
ncbi:hypothetical protein ACFXOD_09025 [Streptomyces sp. NPDC059161]|uniref:hypothetical protein n=1 Tax=Streptomyces sp. NPDC059161 TaxID=3346749 RepID=UPI003681D28F